MPPNKDALTDVAQSLSTSDPAPASAPVQPGPNDGFQVINGAGDVITLGRRKE